MRCQGWLRGKQDEVSVGWMRYHRSVKVSFQFLMSKSSTKEARTASSIIKLFCIIESTSADYRQRQQWGEAKSLLVMSVNI